MRKSQREARATRLAERATLWHIVYTKWLEPGGTCAAERSIVKDVGVREFRDHASSYLSGEEPLAVRRHGRVLGFYLPVRRKNDEQELQAALRELGESLADLRRETGLSEEELVHELVPKAHRELEQKRAGG